MSLAEVVTDSAADEVIEIGGPEPIALDELGRRALAHDGDARSVVADPDAPYFGAKVKERSLVPGPDAHLGKTHFDDWLAQSVVPS